MVFTDRLSNKPFLYWLLPCSLSLTAFFLAVTFHKVMQQHMQGVVRFSVTTLLQIYQEIFQLKQFEKWLKFDRIMSCELTLTEL